jgi:RNA polymerase sigma-70 factor (ECF subfamily)
MAAFALDPDTALMLRVSEGDTPSFSLLLERHRGSVVNHLHRLVRNHAIAEELAQDVFIRVYRSRGNYRPDAKFTTWLFRITMNIALNWRRDTRREAGFVRLDREIHGTRRLQLTDWEPRADELLMRGQREREIRAAI